MAEVVPGSRGWMGFVSALPIPYAVGILGLCALLCRTALFPYPHSGAGQPPLHGDFEAQRHWMELTLHLPIQEWYVNTSRNDLRYWGLDYPPLTAYSSWLLGWVGSFVAPEVVEWEHSRGKEDASAQAFMRTTVLAGDLVVFLPAVAVFVHVVASSVTRRGGKGTLSLLSAPPAQQWAYAPLFLSICASVALQPSLVLVDYGHFQYNNVSLGLFLAALAALLSRRHLTSAVLFCCALNYKQMLLYFAPTIFVYLLAHSWCAAAAGGSGGGLQARTARFFTLVAALALAVVATFGLLWTPFCAFTSHSNSNSNSKSDSSNSSSCWGGLQAVLGRLFPLNRSVFEDKVGNVWCVLDPILRTRAAIYKEAASGGGATPTRTRVVVLCAAITLLASLPPLLWLWRAVGAYHSCGAGSGGGDGDGSATRVSTHSVNEAGRLPPSAVGTETAAGTSVSSAGGEEASTITPSLAKSRPAAQRRRTHSPSPSPALSRRQSPSHKLGQTTHTGRSMDAQAQTTAPTEHQPADPRSELRAGSSEEVPWGALTPVLRHTLTTLLAFFAVATAFFLFSYQVHEKTILLPALVAACFMPFLPMLGYCVQLVATLSMWPLLAAKDGLALPLFIYSLVFAWVAYPSTRANSTEAHILHLGWAAVPRYIRQALHLMFPFVRLGATTMLSWLCPLAMAATWGASLCFTPPPSLPDLYSYLTAVATCASLLLFVAWAWLLMLGLAVGVEVDVRAHEGSGKVHTA